MAKSYTRFTGMKKAPGMPIQKGPESMDANVSGPSLGEGMPPRPEQKPSPVTPNIDQLALRKKRSGVARTLSDR